MKNKTVVLFIISVVLLSFLGSGSAKAFVQAQSVVEAQTPKVAPCLAPAVLKRMASKSVVAVAPAVRASLLPIGWPDWAMWTLIGAVVLLALVVAFLLGRVMAPAPMQPQVVAPVVYIQPPDQSRIVRP